MHDPFPLSIPQGLAKYVQVLADRLDLPTLPLHFHEVLFAFSFYHIVNAYIAPWLSARLFPVYYAKFNARTRLNWNVHIVSLVQSCLINTMALWVIFKDEERKSMTPEEKVWGYTGASGLIQGFAGGYFLWDFFITSINLNVFGIGMLMHAVSALFVFSLGFRPFLNYYGPTFILYELSSPFLNIHWFCDKLNLTGSKIQLYNGILLLLTFFSCRLIWGSYQSIRVFYDIYRAMTSGQTSTNEMNTAKATLEGRADIMRFHGNREIPLWLPATYLGANICLNGLNWYWFGQMIAAIRKRFDPPLGTKGTEKTKGEKQEPLLVEGIDVETDADNDDEGVPLKATGVDGTSEPAQVARGIYADGRRTVEVEKTEVRSRRRG